MQQSDVLTVTVVSRMQAADQIKKMYNFFLSVDATQVEINPFGETPQGEVVCFDAKINFDDNAEFRQKEVRHAFLRVSCFRFIALLWLLVIYILLYSAFKSAVVTTLAGVLPRKAETAVCHF